MEQVTLFIAFAAGILSFLSPCVFPLIPVYVTNLAEGSIKDNKIVADRRILLLRSISFIMGFSVVFILMGTSASLLGELFVEYRPIIERVSGFLIVAFGLQMAGLLKLRMLSFTKGSGELLNVGNGRAKSFFVGVAFGTGWSPCVGLALSAILLMAGSSETMWSGAVLLLVYSIGMGVPFILISLMVTKSLSIMKRMNRWIPKLTIVNGIIFIIMGLLLFTGQFQTLSAWLAGYTFVDLPF